MGPCLQGASILAGAARQLHKFVYYRPSWQSTGAMGGSLAGAQSRQAGGGERAPSGPGTGGPLRGGLEIEIPPTSF